MNLATIQEARERIHDVIRLTPTLFSHTFSARSDETVYFKAECLQRTGSFKLRGALNRIQTFPERPSGVICVSAGNHAQGVALAARIAELPATVVMPETASLTKVERTRGYGADVVLSGRSLEEAMVRAEELQAAHGLTLVHPFADDAVIAGQGTVGLEIVEQLPDVKTVLVPVGGGGLIAGVALAIKEMRPEVRVIGVQAEGAAAAFRSYHEGELIEIDRPETLADGIRVGRTSALTLDLMRRYVDDVVLVSDEEIAGAMVQIMDRSKLMVEAAGAVGVAALDAGKVEPNGTVCCLLSGGNIDLNLVARVIERGLTRAARYTMLRVRLKDSPGALFTLLDPLVRLKVNVLDVKPHRAGYEVPVGWADVDLLVETRDRDHGVEVLAALSAAGLDARTALPS